jgi:hypothetical protein
MAARAARPSSAPARPRGAQGAPRQRPSSAATTPEPGARASTAGASKPDWRPASAVGTVFGDPPSSRLSFLQHPPLHWQLNQRKDVTARDVGKFRPEDCVRVRDGLLETNVKGRPPRPRSATILRAELADLKAPPRATSREVPEAIYLLHCDSTDTALARGPDFWMPERALEARPVGLGRDFCGDGRPRFSKKYGGIVGRLFDDIRTEQAVEAATAEANALARHRRAAAAEEAQKRATAGGGGKARAGGQRYQPADLSALADVPSRRRRRFCLPQKRVRYAPSVPPDAPHPLWSFGTSTLRSAVQIGDLDPLPPPPSRGSKASAPSAASDDGDSAI